MKQKDAKGMLEESLRGLKKWRCSNMKQLKVQGPVQTCHKIDHSVTTPLAFKLRQLTDTKWC